MADEAKVAELIKANPEVDEFLIRKWERIFSMFFDTNSSHEIDWSDFYICLRRVREVYGTESVQVTYARETLNALWTGLKKLAHEHDLITIEDWIGLLKNIDFSNRTDPIWFEQYQKFMFKLFDVSGDGVLDLAEYTDGMSIYGFEYAKCHVAFGKFAIDKKGKPITVVTPELWKTYFNELFFSKDPKAIGNNLFGDLGFSAPAKK